MSKSTTSGKGKLKPNSNLEFQYFLLDAVNDNGTVTLNITQNQPVPEGMVIKFISVLRRIALDGSDGSLLQIGGVWDGADREIPAQIETDTPPAGANYTYNISGTYGVAGDNLSQLLLGSNWVTVAV